MMKSIRNIVVPILVIVLLVGGYLAWRYAEKHPSTDDAYLGANIVQIGAQVTSPVTAVLVQSYQKVSSGQPLIELDPEPFQLAVSRAEIALGTGIIDGLRAGELAFDETGGAVKFQFGIREIALVTAQTGAGLVDLLGARATL